jgi:hypothetical protein
MREGYAGELSSGKKGPKVTDPKQMKAIAASMCYDEGCGGACGCKSCDRAQSRKKTYQEWGYSEAAADTLVFGQQPAALGYPTPTFGPEVMDALNFDKKKKGKSKDGDGPEFMSSLAKKRIHRGLGIKSRNHSESADYSEDVDVDMAMGRIDVMRGRLDELAMKLGMLSELGEVEMAVWMHDKLTLAADYISAVADHAMYGGGIEVEQEEEMSMYGEKKGLWANIHAKKARIKAGSGERMRKPGEKGAPSAKDLKDSQSDDKKFGEGKRPDYPDVDGDGNRKETMESAVRNAKAKKKKAKKAGIKID